MFSRQSTNEAYSIFERPIVFLYEDNDQIKPLSVEALANRGIRVSIGLTLNTAVIKNFFDYSKNSELKKTLMEALKPEYDDIQNSGYVALQISYSGIEFI